MEGTAEALAGNLRIMDLTDIPLVGTGSRRRSEVLLTRELTNMVANDEHHGSSHNVPAVSPAATNSGVHFDTTATLKPFGLLRAVREQTQVALGDIQGAFPEMSPTQAENILETMIDELERRAWYLSLLLRF